MNDEVLLQLQTELGRLGRAYTPADVSSALQRLGLVVSDQALISALAALRNNSAGIGPLEPLLQVPGVSDVLVNGGDGVFIDRGNGMEKMEIDLGGEEQVRRLATRLAAVAERRLDDAQPFVDGRLPDGTRLHAVLAPLAQPGTCISLRIPAARGFTLERLRERGTFSRQGETLLRALIASKVPFLISGGTGSGKTTLLAALLGLISPTERIVVVEDARELSPEHPHCVRMEARPANAEGVGAISLTALVRQALRMRPDRVVVGEVRGAELVDLLAALNTGHEGGCGTVHANSVRDVPARLEALAALGGLGRDACHAQLASALRVVVHIHRGSDRARRLSQVGVLRRGADGLVEVLLAVEFVAGKAILGPGAAELSRLLGIVLSEEER